MSSILNYLMSFFYSLINVEPRGEFNYLITLTVVSCGIGLIVLIVKLVTKLKAFALFGG